MPEISMESSAAAIHPAWKLHNLFSETNRPSFKELDGVIDDLSLIHAPTTEALLGDMATIFAIGQTAAILYEGKPNRLGQKYLSEAQNSARDRLSAVLDKDRPDIESQLGFHAMPKFLLDVVVSDDEDSIIDGLVRKDDNGEYIVPDDTFQNVLEWHNHSMVGRRKRFEDEHWAAFKESHRLRLMFGVHDGWLPEVVLSPDKLKLLDEAKINLDDGLKMYEGKTDGTMHRQDSKSVAEVNLPDNPEPSTVYHELLHVMEGFRTDRKLKTESMRYRSSFGMYRLFGMVFEKAGTMLNEAVTEHITETMVQGSPDVINPDQKPGSYSVERHVLDTLCNYGIKKIDIRLFIEAYFEDTTRKSGGTAMSKLRHELRTAFPNEQVLLKLGQICEHDKKRDTKDDLLRYSNALSDKMAKTKKYSESSSIASKLKVFNLKYGALHRIDVRG